MLTRLVLSKITIIIIERLIYLDCISLIFMIFVKYHWKMPLLCFLSVDMEMQSFIPDYDETDLDETLDQTTQRIKGETRAKSCQMSYQLREVYPPSSLGVPRTSAMVYVTYNSMFAMPKTSSANKDILLTI